jgi:mannose-6-phosphate isomerase-like protein (cupin superfamily)
MKHLRVSLIVALAFAAGVFCARAPQVARAADAVVEATTIDLTALDPATFPPPNPALPNIRTKTLATVDQTVFALSVGTAPKHTHESTTEVQLVMDGTGTEWLGDKQIPLKPARSSSFRRTRRTVGSPEARSASTPSKHRPKFQRIIT